MNRQQQIDTFLQAAHRLAVARLRADPDGLRRAGELLARWRGQNGTTRADVYRDEWARLLASGPDAIERAVCGDDEHAAVLRSVSPLSVLISQQERASLLRAARTAAR